MGVTTSSTDPNTVLFAARTKEEQLFGWLIEAGMHGMRIDQLIAQFCEKLTDLGVQLTRGNIALSTIHPQVSAFMYTWRKEGGIVANTNVLHSEEPGEGWFASPFFFMLNNRVSFMQRSLENSEELDFPVLVEFRDQGMTDWFSQIFDFGWGFQDDFRDHSSGLITSWASSAPGGFSKEELNLLRRAIPLFALTVKGIASFKAAETVLETYIGKETSRKVLSGEIMRGKASSISAILIFADLRGFTRLSDVTGRSDVVATLDQYLERMVAPIEEAGGEILKFMGDGILATFALDNEDEKEVCKKALVSSLQMISGVKQLNSERLAQGRRTMELDIAVHVGEVMYGNVGSKTRLDFTVVGPAVNEVSRIETLCDQLDTDLLMSGAFVETSGHLCEHLESVGLHHLRGVQEPKELFKIRDCDVFSKKQDLY
ncbi:adenylate/guanylate cyclase domain-containing protein [Sneathiella aquimaris]|uniref:adenylate/guanylate cyclase domain-containing protein n=1 Tax=Sneathiella aquimaris TaxID=2599305 RepID=UPI00146C28FC|nr:adenylate/guanylate cyclase domain-containing protein [Sneathiella aquimaris]